MERNVVAETDEGYLAEVHSLPEDRAMLAVLFPHGGEIESGTEQQALELDERLHSGLWGCIGYHDDGAFDKLHIPSTYIRDADFPLLVPVRDGNYDVVISFHRKGGSGVVVGGRPSRLKRDISSRLEKELEYEVETAVRGKYGGTHPSNVGNRVAGRSGTYIQIESPPDLLDSEGFPVVDVLEKELLAEGFYESAEAAKEAAESSPDSDSSFWKRLLSGNR